MARFFHSNLWNTIRWSAYLPFYDLIEKAVIAHRVHSIELLGLKPGERVLLLGAGTGLDLAHLPPGCEVSAVDITPGMLWRLQRRARRLGIEVDARVMDAQALQYPAGSFDCVVLHLILAVIPDGTKCLQEAERVLVPGGRAVVFDKFLGEGQTPSLLRRAAGAVIAVLFTDINRRLGDMVAQTGFRLISDEPVMLGGMFRVALLQKPGGQVAKAWPSSLTTPPRLSSER